MSGVWPVTGQPSLGASVFEVIQILRQIAVLSVLTNAIAGVAKLTSAFPLEQNSGPCALFQIPLMVELLVSLHCYLEHSEAWTWEETLVCCFPEMKGNGNGVLRSAGFYPCITLILFMQALTGISSGEWVIRQPARTLQHLQREGELTTLRQRAVLHGDYVHKLLQLFGCTKDV